ncbi:MAG: ATP synthase F1 subunit gamma [Bacteroidales bacterium]|nr:ATP synthase F1 subunit gamma [Bacteroidales bacterium]
MPTLKEIKGRIASVQNTLKITSAMKLVSSAKLRKAQTAIENMRPYEEKLQEILALATDSGNDSPKLSLRDPVRANSFGESSPESTEVKKNNTVIVAMASNSSLCGGFNANAIAKVKAVLKEHPGATVYSIGRKMADAMRKAGYPSPKDFTTLSEHPSYGPVSDLVDKFLDDDSDVILVYNHFVSTGKQVPVAEPLVSNTPETPGTQQSSSSDLFRGSEDVIVEPSKKALLEALYPKTLKIKLFAALLDSAAAEHAARTVAMQTATDNGEDLLAELTLQYNKGRQQKITNEILDLAGGRVEQ